MIKFKLKVELAKADMTQKALAERTGIRPSTISDISKGTVKHLPVDALNKICAALDCQPADLMEQLKTQADGLRDDIKSEMTTRGTEELNLGKYIVRWTSVLSTRFDTKRFKEVFGEELYKAYTKEVSSRRFSIA